MNRGASPKAPDVRLRLRFGLGLGLGLGIALSLSFVLSAAALLAQSPGATTKHVSVAPVAAVSADVSSLDGIVKAYYEVISGPAGRPREWSRDRTLYVPDVRFVEIHEKKGGGVRALTETHEEYVDRTDAPLVRDGFDEREIHRVTQQFGSIANIFSTYESRRTAGGPVIARGINRLQLFHDGTRWFIASATWQDESPQHPIPKTFLP
jgi:hypothetical protein